MGRRVKQGAHALAILIPIIPRSARTEPSLEEEPEEQEERQKPVGFKLMPVFRVQDTGGEALPYELRMRAFDVSSLPLVGVARTLGVTVKAGLLPPSCAAVYKPGSKQIVLGTDNPQTFLHELSHAVDSALPGKSEDYDFCEVVAELSSCFLGSLYGVSVDIGATKAYIEHYAKRGHVAFALAHALGRVESIYAFIEGRRISAGRSAGEAGICRGDGAEILAS